MKVELYGPERRLIVSGVRTQGPARSRRHGAWPGAYEAVFHVASWYREQRVSLPAVPFLDEVHYRFGISDPKQHYHLPFKCTPWGYSCFRGGA